MKVSVIIPCYNFENYIEQAILSALSQKTNFDFEILVRDDKSTDDSYQNIIRYAGALSNNKVRILDSTVNLGASRNIKTLVDNCKGEYIAYLDGDDYWMNINKLQEQISYMDANTDCVMTFTGYWMKENGQYVPPEPGFWLCIPKTYQNGEVTTEQLLNGNPSSFGRVFRNINGLIKDWMLDCKFFDWVTSYELSKYGKLKYLDFPTGVYRAHGSGVLTSLTSQDLHNETEITKQKLIDNYNNWILEKNI